MTNLEDHERQIEKYFTDTNEAKDKFISDLYDQIYTAVSLNDYHVIIDVEALKLGNDEIASYLLQSPIQAIKFIKKYIGLIAKDYEETADDDFFVEIINLAPIHSRTVTSGSPKDAFKLIELNGTVRLVQERSDKLHIAAFYCKECDVTNYKRITVESKITPILCNCKTTGTITKLSEENSKYISCQFIDVQNDFSDIGTTEEMQNTVDVMLVGPLVGKATAGSKVKIVGISHRITRIDTRTGKPRARAMTLIEALSVKPREESMCEVILTKFDLTEIEKIAKEENPLDDILAPSIAPEIKGNEFLKQSIALQQMGGVSKTKQNGLRLRGEIHVLVVGDPGTAKSQLLLWVANNFPKCIYTVSKTTTGCGLTVTAERESGPDGEGRWTLKPGALVLANGGCVCSDEFEKMPQSDREFILPAMEQGIIPVAKGTFAGISLLAHTSILAAANPMEGRYNLGLTISENINLEATIIGRFDAIFHIIDTINEKKDRSLAKHILKVHSGKDEDIYEGKISKELLIKYFVRAKELNPILSQETMDYIEDHYIDIRKRSTAKEYIATARQLESFIRLSEASARSHLHKEVMHDDVDKAIEIFEGYLSTLGGSIDNVLGEVSTKVREIKIEIRKLLKADSHPEDEVVNVMISMGYRNTDIIHALKKLWESGDIIWNASNEVGLARH